LVDLSMRGEDEGSPGYLAFLTADGRLHTLEVRRATNAEGNPILKPDSPGGLGLPAYDGGKPSYLMLTGIGDSVFVACEDGRSARVNARDTEAPRLVEELRLTNGGARLTALAFLAGKASLLAGDSTGRIRAWFTHRQEKANDGHVTAAAHDLGSLG